MSSAAAVPSSITASSRTCLLTILLSRSDSFVYECALHQQLEQELAHFDEISSAAAWSISISPLFVFTL